MSAGAARALDGEYVPSPDERARTQVADYEATNGVEGGTLEGKPVGGDRYIVVASAGGSPNHPAWYANLVAHPLVRIQDGQVVSVLRAREVHGDEKAHYWTIAESFWPHFPEYRQSAAGREIPVLVLEPEAASST